MPDDNDGSNTETNGGGDYGASAGGQGFGGGDIAAAGGAVGMASGMAAMLEGSLASGALAMTASAIAFGAGISGPMTSAVGATLSTDPSIAGVQLEALAAFGATSMSVADFGAAPGGGGAVAASIYMPDGSTDQFNAAGQLIGVIAPQQSIYAAADGANGSEGGGGW